MNLIKLYRGNNDFVMALYEDVEGFYVSETGSDWYQELIAKRGAVSVEEAIAYTDDIAQHAPACYKPVEPESVDFLDWVIENGYTFTIAPDGDGASEYDGQDISWSWSGADREAMKSISSDRIWTVVDGDGDDPENPMNLYVVPGKHFVNRHFYLVLDQPVMDKGQFFIW